MNGPFIIAYDLGTGGNKASLYDAEGNCLGGQFVSYTTRYPQAGWHEQRPLDWWNAIVESTRKLLAETKVPKDQIVACGISGHSLGVVPIGHDGALLRDGIPIWSDSRPQEQPKRFFEKIDETAWYEQTGCGFPPPLYSIFKIMWYRDHEPEMFRKIHKIIGTKDYINFKLTGRLATDFSYASGSGVYDLMKWNYSEKLIDASALPREIFPDLVPSTEVLGQLTKEAAEELGLTRSVKVVAGGVDNSCMALGARNIEEGRAYNSLGSSSWIAVCSAKPLLNATSRPYVFTHVIPGLFTSAIGVFSTGTSFRWVRDQICQNLMREADEKKSDVYSLMTALAETSPVGSKKLLFNPSLAGGNSMDVSRHIRGAFMGLDLGHTQADMIRASMEGISLALRVALDELRRLTPIRPPMLMVGGGSRSTLWRQIYADIYKMEILKTNIDQQAAALGAAALAAVGIGLWPDFRKIDTIHQVEAISKPIPGNSARYDQLLPIFKEAAACQSRIGDLLAQQQL